MNRTFNNGIGMVLVLAPEQAAACAQRCARRASGCSRSAASRRAAAVPP
jgi:phosphoribosylaminoimidazole (AIR) synthetase